MWGSNSRRNFGRLRTEVGRARLHIYGRVRRRLASPSYGVIPRSPRKFPTHTFDAIHALSTKPTLHARATQAAVRVVVAISVLVSLLPASADRAALHRGDDWRTCDSGGSECWAHDGSFGRMALPVAAIFALTPFALRRHQRALDEPVVRMTRGQIGQLSIEVRAVASFAATSSEHPIALRHRSDDGVTGGADFGRDNCVDRRLHVLATRPDKLQPAIRGSSDDVQALP